MTKIQNLNKELIISIIIFLLLILFFLQPKIFSQVFQTILGRSFLVILIVCITYCNQMWGILFVLFLMIMYTNDSMSVEGFTWDLSKNNSLNLNNWNLDLSNNYTLNSITKGLDLSNNYNWNFDPSNNYTLNSITKGLDPSNNYTLNSITKGLDPSNNYNWNFDSSNNYTLNSITKGLDPSNNYNWNLNSTTAADAAAQANSQQSQLVLLKAQQAKEQAYAIANPNSPEGISYAQQQQSQQQQQQTDQQSKIQYALSNPTSDVGIRFINYANANPNSPEGIAYTQSQSQQQLNAKTLIQRLTPTPTTTQTLTQPKKTFTCTENFKSLEGFDLLGLEDGMKRGKQSNSIQVGNSYNNHTDDVMPYEESFFSTFHR